MVSTQAKFDQLYIDYDIYHTGANKGKWYADYSTSVRGVLWGWGWSYVGMSLIYMYMATKDKKYLNYMIPQMDYIKVRRDTDLGVESYYGTGRFLPAWNDGGYYSATKKPHTYAVHTGQIVLPFLFFIDTVRKKNLTEYNEKADEYLRICGEALNVHNEPAQWVDYDATHGTMKDVDTTSDISTAGRVLPENMTFSYLSACGYYDYLAGTSIYTEKINKFLNYFRDTCINDNFDVINDAYYWSYWFAYWGDTKWDDVSHARLVVQGLKYLNDLGFTQFKGVMNRFANIVTKITSNDPVPLVAETIHGTVKKPWYTGSTITNQYYPALAGFAVLADYNEDILYRTDAVSEKIYTAVTTGERPMEAAYLQYIASNLVHILVPDQPI